VVSVPGGVEFDTQTPIGENIDQKHGNTVEVKPHIAFLYENGFAARMMLRSGLGKELVVQGAEVTAISPNADEAYFQKECREDGIKLEQEPQKYSRVAELFRSYRPYLLDDVMGNPSLRAVHFNRLRNRPVLQAVTATINKHFAPLSIFRYTTSALERTLNRSRKIKHLLARVRPDLLVLPNPFGEIVTIYLLHAKELGIPTVCQMLSWDNVTSKGTPLAMPDCFISWGPIMTEEIAAIYHFPRQRIYECGVPHFDVYSRRDQLTPRHVVAAQLNLNVDEPYIFYGMVLPGSCPNEMQILEWLVKQIVGETFSKPCSLVIRPHPQTIRGMHQMDVARFERLHSMLGPRVALDLPPVLSERLFWDLPKSDMYHLASVLTGSAICINANSTLCIDACMADRPVITIAFDGWKDLPYHRSVRRGLDFTHIAKLLALGGVRIARSFDDLFEHIDAYLNDPALDRRARSLSVARECGLQDGQATERVANTLLNLVDRSSKRSFKSKRT
jgi:hypothetical protein